MKKYKVKTPSGIDSSYLKPDTEYWAHDHPDLDGFMVVDTELGDGAIAFKKGPCGHLQGKEWIHVEYSNRQQLNDFIKQNQINKSKVSLMLGKSRNWLDTLASNSELKRRGDISDSKLDEAMSLLNIDWTSNKVMHVNTKGFVPYITRPCTYHTDTHKARLQRAYWDGEVTL